MLRYLCLTLVGLFVVGTMNLRADELPKRKLPEKAEIKQEEAGPKTVTKQKVAEKGKPREVAKVDKSTQGRKSKLDVKQAASKQVVKVAAKQPVKSSQKKPPQEVPVRVLGRSTEFYTASPAQGQPADGKLMPGTTVSVVERAGDYVRIVAQVEVFVPADSLAESKQTKGEPKKNVDASPVKQPALDKAVLSKQKEAANAKPAVVKQKVEPTHKPEKQAPPKETGKSK